MNENRAPNVRAVPQTPAAPHPGYFRWYLEQQVFQPLRLDYDIAIDLAYQWQKRAKQCPPTLLLLWPALAVTSGSSDFLSFDPRTRHLAGAAGLKLLPETL